MTNFYRAGVRCGAAILLGASQTVASAQSHDWFVHVGPAMLTLADKAEIDLAGAPLPGSGVDTDPQYTGAVEIGYFVVPTIAISVALGVPPVAKFDGTGSIDAVGRLGSARYGPAGLTAQWHPLRNGRFDPYLGVGVAYMHFFSTKDGAL